MRKFVPRIHENGGICCSAELALCDKCKAHFAWGGAPRAASLRTAVPHDYTPPNSYERDLQKLRDRDAQAAAARTHQPPPRPSEMHLDANGIPDPYFHAIQARLREENR
jgi:hypothetical protein